MKRVPDDDTKDQAPMNEPQPDDRSIPAHDDDGIDEGGETG